ncbi:MAG: translation initiation factor IF-3 [Parcubacteria group bacterium CG1_02_44_65]|nr:MAG: translation initiation factor IF-3 [Parcubacteria group bacterium CG1_02_44_65]
MYRKPYYQPQKRIRTNEWIRVSPILLIDEKGRNLGVVETSKALQMSRDKGLDLIEIAPQAQPPVCRIMDYGKYKYEQSRKERGQKAKQKQVEIKGVRIGLGTGKHDLEIRARQAEKFLSKGDKVRVEMILRGREKALLNVAFDKLNEFIKMIPVEVKIEQEIKKQPRGLATVISR